MVQLQMCFARTLDVAIRGTVLTTSTPTATHMIRKVEHAIMAADEVTYAARTSTRYTSLVAVRVIVDPLPFAALTLSHCLL